MKIFAQTFIVLLLCITFAYSQHENHKMPEMPDTAKPMELLPNAGFVQHKVSTTNKEAQQYFNQGLTLYYAFNEGDAARSFQKATELDRNLAIAFWGVALAKMPSYNDPNPDNAKKLKEAHEAMKMALAMNAPPAERAYIEALSKGFSDAEKPDTDALNLAYKNAMGEVCKKYPKDSDAATLYALNILNLQADSWTKDGKPLENTLEMVNVLESGLKRDPKHLGLNHIYIHAIEGSPNPERALKSANLIRSLKLNSPPLGHLIHMPAHIYVRIGDFQAAVEANEETAKMPTDALPEDFKKFHYGHVYDFLTYSYSMQGNYAKTRGALERNFDVRNPKPTAEQLALRSYKPSYLVRFRRWDDILKLPAPNPNSPPANRSTWIWARTQAFAATGKMAEAEAEHKLYLAAKNQWLEMLAKQMPKWRLAVFSNLILIDENKLEAALAAARGDRKTAIEFLRKAVVAEDEIPYNEPPIMQAPTRETLGGVLLLIGNPAEAEQVFREDLRHNRGNGRSLFGLMKSLEAQNKTKETKQVEREFQAAWKYADTQLRVEDL